MLGCLKAPISSCMESDTRLHLTMRRASGGEHAFRTNGVGDSPGGKSVSRELIHSHKIRSRLCIWWTEVDPSIVQAGWCLGERLQYMHTTKARQGSSEIVHCR